MLEWSPLLIEEIVTKDADIVGLEEVDHFDYFQTHLADYHGLYFAKRDKPDGMALFVKGSTSNRHGQNITTILRKGLLLQCLRTFTMIDISLLL